MKKNIKRFNKSNIMKRAWEMHRSYRYSALTFGQCLSRAWEEAKEAVEKEMQEAEEAAFYGVKFADGMTIKVAGRAYTLNRWTKYDNDRIYVNREDGNKEGFVDLKWHKDCLAQGRRFDYHKRMAEMILSMQF